MIREHLRRGRPSVTELPATLVPFELLFQAVLLGGATADARQYYGQIVSELETVAAEYLSNPLATVADSLMATSRVYSLFQSLAPNDDSVQEVEMQEEPSETEDENAIATESFNRRQSQQNPSGETSASFSTPGTIPTAKVSLMNLRALKRGGRLSFRNKRLKKARWPSTMTSGIAS